ncbi:MAG: gluconate 2-dehydrogenase subunit 3 family protein, partial [Anaerolineae bacterium]|nr:gluconate 2-dehydrogenase subunit 3 family protein [Anaerolineae bacterium]
MAFLSSAERHTLSLICDTFIPALPPHGGADPRLFGLGAAQFNTAEQVETAFERVTDESDREQLKLVLRLLEVGATNGIAAGVWKGFSDLNLEDRTAVLRAWANSSLAASRKLFQSLKRLTLFLFYSTMPDNEPNPVWSAFGYGDLPRPS